MRAAPTWDWRYKAPRTGVTTQCLVCGADIYRGPAQKIGKFCSAAHRKEYEAAHRLTLEQRFWTKVNKAGPLPLQCPELGVCWLWTASANSNGYGQISNPVRGERPLSTHRLSWKFAFGEPTADLFVCHRCDTPLCVNPAHLYLATNAQNLEDAKANGIKVGIQRSPFCKRGHVYEQRYGRQYCPACAAIRFQEKRRENLQTI